jgi:galactokinase
VEIATSVPGVEAARMTGGGFGGCTVNLVARNAVDRLREAVDREYPERTGRKARVFAVEPADGAGRVA